MGCTQGKYRERGVAIATVAASSPRRRVDSLRKIPTRLFAVWSGRRDRSQQPTPQTPQPRPPSIALNLRAPPQQQPPSPSPSPQGFDCARDPSQEDSLAQLDATRERTRNAYEDFGLPPLCTVDAYDRLDFDDSPMDAGAAAFFL